MRLRCGRKAHLFECVLHVRALARLEEGNDGRPLPPRLRNDEVEMLLRERNESEAVAIGYGGDRHTPIGASLRDRGSDGIVRARLIPIARRFHAFEQLVDKHTRAGALVAIDHVAVLIGKRGSDRIIDALPLKTCIALPEDDALHAPPAFDERQAVVEKWRVIRAALCVEEMRGRDVAFAAPRRMQSAERADRDDTRANSGSRSARASIVRKPSACAKLVTAPEPLPSGKALSPVSSSLSATIANSVRPKSEGIATAVCASTIDSSRAGRP